MNGNDGRNTPEWPINPEQPRREPPREYVRERGGAAPAARKRGINPVLLALGGLLLLLLLLWLFTGNRSADQDKLTGNEAGEEAASAADPEKRCASQATYDLIKRDLFRRAAQVRGSDQGAFDRLAAYAAIRMENPVLESEDSNNGAVRCSGSLSIDLPPGVQVVGGRRTLNADIDYSLRGAADRSGDVVTIRNADAIVTPLATLARTNAAGTTPPAANGQADDPDVLGPVPPGTAPPPQAIPPVRNPNQPPPPPVQVPPRASTSAAPSFNCANASTRSERAVCSDSGLASLDRQMAAQFNSARSGASAQERALLDRTRGRFLSYRNGCRSDDCIADAYRGRMREISDIMAGRWQPR
jgi:hypothetical protein